MEWKYIEPLKKSNAVESFLNNHGVVLSKEIVAFIVKHNAGRPSVNRFDTDKSKECVFDGVFSYNEEDSENIYGIYEGELKESLKKDNLYPVGMEPGGDLICVDLKDKAKIKLFRMESGEIEFVAENLGEMLDQLY